MTSSPDPAPRYAVTAISVSDRASDGRREDAEEVRRLAKPTLPAWVVNQLTRRDRRDVDLLLDAGHRLRTTQGGSGSREKLDDAVRAVHTAFGLDSADGEAVVYGGSGR